MSEILGNADAIASFTADHPEQGFPMAHSDAIATFAIAGTPIETVTPVPPVTGLVAELIETAETNDKAKLWGDEAVVAAGLPEGSQVLDIAADPDQIPILTVDSVYWSSPPAHIPSLNTRIITQPLTSSADEFKTTIMVHVRPEDFTGPQKPEVSRAWAKLDVDASGELTRLSVATADFTLERPEQIGDGVDVGLEAFLAAV